MKTIETTNGLIPEHRVIRFYTEEVKSRHGKTFTQHCVEYEGAEGTAHARCHEHSAKPEAPLIPAAPGFSLLSYNHGLYGDETHAALADSVPVVAWRLRSDRVEPVPLGSLLDTGNLKHAHLAHYAVLTPDGTVYVTEPYIHGPEDEGDDAIPSYSLGDPITTRFESVREWAQWEASRMREVHESVAKKLGSEAA